MNEKVIVDRIISDAEQEAKAIIDEAQSRAARTVAEASENAERHKKGTEAEIKEKAQSIFDGKAASARLDGAKILLSEKRGVIDEIYARAYKQLVEMNKRDALYLAEKLIRDYADEGDEIVFAENYLFVADVAKLDIVKEKKLKISSKRAPIGGGFMLCGKNSDKNLSIDALLAEDREEKQAEIAASLFITG